MSSMCTLTALGFFIVLRTMLKPAIDHSHGKWKMENGKWKMENGKWKMENGKWLSLLYCLLFILVKKMGSLRVNVN